MVHPRYRQTASPGARLSGKEKPSRSHAEERKKEDSRKPPSGTPEPTAGRGREESRVDKRRRGDYK